MNADDLLKNYERVADAPDAIARLRRFVLDLAVRGKLVAQNTKDESASELLKSIVETKARLKIAGKGMKPKPIRVVEDPPFELPQNWLWTHIREVTSDRGQEIPKARFTYIDVTAINKELGVVEDPKVLTASGAPSRARKIVCKGDVIYSCVRPYLLNVAIVDADFDPAPIASTAFAVLNGHGLVLPRYLWIVLRSPYMVECVEENQRGQAYPAINDSDFAVLPFPLPPLAEQHRIAAKVDELMTLCDRLQAAVGARERTRDQLVAASLHRLITDGVGNVEVTTEPADFHLKHLTRFTRRSEHVKQLRQAFLRLAVRGNLVPQNLMDEPAIALDKAISPAELPFDIPKGWRWARIRILGNLKGGGTPSKTREDFWGGLIPWASPKDMKVDYLAEAQMSITEAAITGSAVNLIKPGSIVFVVRGMILAHSFPVAVTRVPIAINQDMKALELKRPEMAEYLLRALKGLKPEMIARVQRSSHGTCRLERADYSDFLVPIPPISEQHRIVAKVDELMALCDQLEVSLSAAQRDRSLLLGALLHQALQPDFAKSDQRIRDKWRTRSAISSYVVSRLSSKRGFGRTAHMKHLYLAEAYLGLDLDGAYARETAGPLDVRIYDLEKQATSSGWYSPRVEVLASGQEKVTYSPGKSIKEIVDEGVAVLGTSRTELDRILGLMGDMSTEEVEIVATLFAAWNDALIDGEFPDDDWVIREVRENWHPSKKRFQPALLGKWLAWMRLNHVVPTGKMPRTIQQKTLSFG